MMIPDCIDKKVCVTDNDENIPFEKIFNIGSSNGIPMCLANKSGVVQNGKFTITIEDLIKITGHINYLKISNYECLLHKDLSDIDCIVTEPGINLSDFVYIPTDNVYLHRRFFDKKVLFVTAFKNIKRDTWGYSTRVKEDYFKWYEYLKKAVNPFVCFSDDVENALPFEEEKTFFSLIERDRKCMESEYYKKVMAERIHYPEHCKPEYTSVTHTKVNFVARAARMFPDYSHYVWIDFGYFRSEDDIPEQWLLASLFGTKIHFALFHDLPFFRSPKEICQSGSNFIQGGMFIVPREHTEWLEIQYRRSLDAFYNDGFADDEQAIFLHIQTRFPHMFQFHKINEWFGIRKLYSLKKKT